MLGMGRAREYLPKLCWEGGGGKLRHSQSRALRMGHPRDRLWGWFMGCWGKGRHGALVQQWGLLMPAPFWL